MRYFSEINGSRRGLDNLHEARKLDLQDGDDWRRLRADVTPDSEGKFDGVIMRESISSDIPSQL